jgi:hypothetical protein
MTEHIAHKVSTGGAKYSKLLASSPTLEGATQMVAKFWPDCGYTLISSGEGVWQPRSAKGREPNGFTVILEKGRYKFVAK